MQFDILAQVAAWAVLAASECPGVAYAVVPFGANADEMRDDRGGVRYAGLPLLDGCSNILWAEGCTAPWRRCCLLANARSC